MMWTDDWMRQRRRVRRLEQFIDEKRVEEQRLRQGLKNRSRALLTRFETLFLVGATGAVWSARLQDQHGDEHKRPVVELISAAVIVHRWRDIARNLNTRWISG